ncbi:MAG: MBL fold metallo-hydrolase [Acidimicrobiales bacterium]|nr:MBL fold metallo-hydrolase [Acidimicrobiales bacterium]
MTDAAAALLELAPGVSAWLQQPASHDLTNAGVIVDDDGITVVDTLLTPSLAKAFDEQLAELGLPVRRAVYTSSHVAFTGGSSVFWRAARYGRSLTSAVLDTPPNLGAIARLHPGWADELAGLSTRPVSHTVDTAAYLTASHLVVPTQGQQAQNLVVLVPGADVLFAGAMACIGVTPNAFDGDPLAWADALGELAELASVVVPGIGPVGAPDDLVVLQAYLYACVEAEGDPGAVPSGPWDAWRDRHLDEVNVERAALLARGDDGVPPSMLRLLGLA